MSDLSERFKELLSNNGVSVVMETRTFQEIMSR